jgi:hypothetical protein
MKYEVSWRHAAGGGGAIVDANSIEEAIQKAGEATGGAMAGHIDVRIVPELSPGHAGEGDVPRGTIT